MKGFAGLLIISTLLSVIWNIDPYCQLRDTNNNCKKCQPNFTLFQEGCIPTELYASIAAALSANCKPGYQLSVSGQCELKSAATGTKLPPSPTSITAQPIPNDNIQKRNSNTEGNFSASSRTLQLNAGVDSQKLTVSISGPNGMIPSSLVNELRVSIVRYNMLNPENPPVLMRSGTGALILTNVTSSMKEIYFSSCGCESPINNLTKVAIQTYITQINVLSVDSSDFEINGSTTIAARQALPNYISFNPKNSSYVTSKSGWFDVDLLKLLLNGLKTANEVVIFPNKLVVVNQNGTRINQSVAQRQPSPLYIVTVSADQMSKQSTINLQDMIKTLSNLGNDISLTLGPGPLSRLCYSYDSRGFCASCFKGFSLDLGYCVMNPSNMPQGCQNLNEQNECILCKNRFFMRNGVCMPVNDKCKDYNPKTGECLSCIRDYALVWTQRTGQICQSTITYSKKANSGSQESGALTMEIVEEINKANNRTVGGNNGSNSIGSESTNMSTASMSSNSIGGNSIIGGSGSGFGFSSFGDGGSGASGGSGGGNLFHTATSIAGSSAISIFGGSPNIKNGSNTIEQTRTTNQTTTTLNTSVPEIGDGILRKNDSGQPPGTQSNETVPNYNQNILSQLTNLQQETTNNRLLVWRTPFSQRQPNKNQTINNQTRNQRYQTASSYQSKRGVQRIRPPNQNPSLMPKPTAKSELAQKIKQTIAQTLEIHFPDRFVVNVRSESFNNEPPPTKTILDSNLDLQNNLKQSLGFVLGRPKDQRVVYKNENSKNQLRFADLNYRALQIPAYVIPFPAPSRTFVRKR